VKADFLERWSQCTVTVQAGYVNVELAAAVKQFGELHRLPLRASLIKAVD
jgi:hypothetical protein